MTLSLYAMLMLLSVRRPLDGGQVYAVFVHFPQGGQLAQLGHVLLDGLDGVIDLFFGGPTTNGHAQAAVGQLVAAAQGAQHIAGLQAGRGAGRAGRHRQALDAHDQRLAFDEVEAHVDVLRHALGGVAIEEHLFQVGQAVDQALVQSSGLGVVLVHFEFGDAEGLALADDLVCGQRARAHAALMATAVHLSLQTHARLAAHVQRTNAFGAIGLVRGQAHQVDRQGVQVDGDLARCLRRIHMEEDALLAAHRADAGNVLHHTDFVVHEHHADEDGVRADRGFERIHAQQAVVLHVQVGHVKALTLQFAHGVEHGLVLGLDGDQVLAAGFVKLRRALEGQVVRLGGAAGPDDFARIGTDQVGHILAGFLDGFFGLPAPGMAAGSRVAEMLTQPGNHGDEHTRVARRGGTVVHVDREVRGAAHGCTSCWGNQDLANTLPRSKTELGPVTRMGLTTGVEEIARLMVGLLSTTTPLAIWSSTSFCRETESRNSTILAFSADHRSCVMQRLSPPWQFSLPPQWVASSGSSTDRMMSATVMSSALRPRVSPPPGPRGDSTSWWRRSLPKSCSRYDSEMRWRWLMAARVTGPLFWRRAKSIMAVTAKRPLVVRRIASSLLCGLLVHELPARFMTGRHRLRPTFCRCLRHGRPFVSWVCPCCASNCSRFQIIFVG